MATFMLILNIVILLVAILLIVSVLMQQGNSAGLGAISGGAETFFGKSKAKSYEGKLELITKISAIVFTLLVITLAATYNRYGTGTSSSSSAVLPTVAPVEATAVPEASAAADTTVTVAPTAAAEAAATPAVEATVAAEVAATPAPEPTVAAEAAATAAALPTEAPAASPAA